MKSRFTPCHWRVCQAGDVPFASASEAVAAARRSANAVYDSLPWYKDTSSADVREHRVTVFAVAEATQRQGEELWYGTVIVLPFPGASEGSWEVAK